MIQSPETLCIQIQQHARQLVEALEDHELIAQALVQRDAKKIEKALETHFENTI